jgi:hypothetical protein
MGACEMLSCQLFEVFENTLRRLLMTFGDWLVMVMSGGKHVIFGDAVRRGDTDVSVIVVPLLVAHQSGEISCIPHAVQWWVSFLE